MVFIFCLFFVCFLFVFCLFFVCFLFGIELCVLDKIFCGCGFEDIFLKGFDMFCCFCVCFFIVV